MQLHALSPTFALTAEAPCDIAPDRTPASTKDCCYAARIQSVRHQIVHTTQDTRDHAGHAKLKTTSWKIIQQKEYRCIPLRLRFPLSPISPTTPPTHRATYAAAQPNRRPLTRGRSAVWASTTACSRRHFASSENNNQNHKNQNNNKQTT